MNKRAVIIGGGLGGLFAGAILSKEGLKVSVIEKNVTVGGGLQSFTRFGEVFDTGMHVIGGLQKGGAIRRLCEYLGIFDKMEIADLDHNMIDNIYISEDRRHYHIAQGKHGFVEALAESFPGQRQNIEKYVEAVYRITRELDLYCLRPSQDYMKMYSDEFMMSATDFISKYIPDERLRSIVAYMNPLYSGRKNITPAYVHALISSIYIDGPSRFVGGSYLFANTLRDFIVGNGGEVIVGDGAAKVFSSGKTVTGVKTKAGRIFTGDYYISAIHPCSLIGILDDPTILSKIYRTRLESIPNSYSAFSVNIKFKPESFPYLNYTGYYMKRYDQIWDFGDLGKEWPVGFLYMTPPEPGQGKYSDKMILTSPMQWDEVKRWDNTFVGHRGDEYKEWKRQCAEKLFDCMEEVHPGFKDSIVDYDSSSPLTIRDFYGAKEGGMCGYSKDCNNILLSQVPVVTKAANLFFTGQNCNLHGFCGVPLTAIATCEAILGRNYIVNKIINCTEQW